MKLFIIISLLFIANFAFAQEEMIISCQIQSYDWKKYQVDPQKRPGKSGDRETISKSEKDFPNSFLFKIDSQEITPLDSASPISTIYFQKNNEVTELKNSNSNYKWGIKQTRKSGDQDTILISREGGKLIYTSYSPKQVDADVDVYTSLKLEGFCSEQNQVNKQLQAITPIPPQGIESVKWEFVGHEYLFRDDDIIDNYDRDFYLAKNTATTIDDQQHMYLYFNIVKTPGKVPKVSGQVYQSALVYGYPICRREMFIPKEIKYFTAKDLKGKLIETELAEWKKYANKNFIQLKSIVSQSKRQGRELNLYITMCKKPGIRSD
jgi:hypothetical protein